MTHFYRVLADETRRKILALTAQREYTQAELVSLFDVSQPAIKKHLDLLLKEQLLHERKEGRYRYYKLHLDNFKDKKAEVEQELNQILKQKLVDLKSYLEEGY
ncbi:DNA-binding transcriptional ArsR family regulator [Alkalihalobacillus xiaoxiensis]|uniref:DNA-binding transcriptional ArsR family regulator n=1 Tax=Shouchella xiaoxiensis TaxID=766895 RepID=A0ABS2T1E1_9BACI|nr:metalloregulator ArsR/SmtB family transcription factor [Shouchella xiaoxiensis]MBM7841276.1 DNA-binding transcriptional ArsR family regulator [Shouchella xiaoxiensis]